jgi:Tfp pilus assembly protein PilX
MSFLRRLLRRQDGITLVMAIGILGVLTMSGTALIYYSNTNARSAEYSDDKSSAYDLAEAGVNEMMAILSRPENNALKSDLLPQTTSTYDKGTVTWSGTLNQATQTWSITSTGVIKNPTGASAANVRRTLTAQVPVTPSFAQPLNNPAWNYVFATRTGTPGGCDETLNNNVSGGSRLYISGNLCLNNNVSVTSEPLVVKGKLQLNNGAAIGASTNMSTRVTTYVGGSGGQYCQYGGQAWDPSGGHPNCSDYDHVYSKLPDGSTIGVTTAAGSIPQIAAPVVDWDTWYTNSIPGPTNDCSATNGAKSGTTPTWDNNGVRNPTTNGSVATVFDLTPSSSYNCRIGPVRSPSGCLPPPSYTGQTAAVCTQYPSGELAWDASTKTLTAYGTVFIDGSLKIANNSVNQYNGRATIYLSGTLYLNGSMCGGIVSGNCDFASWDPNKEMLTLVVGGDGANMNGGQQVPSGFSVDFANSSQFQGAIYSTNAANFGNNAKTDGPLVASYVVYSNNVQSDNFPTVQTVPAGMPGNPAVYAQPNPPKLYSG